MGNEALAEFDRAPEKKFSGVARFWNRDQDFKQLSTWFNNRHEKITLDRVPILGIIIDNIGAVFLFRDPMTSIAFAHPFISNPSASKKDVVMGLRKIIEFGKFNLKVIGIDTIVLFSTYRSLLKICRESGFSQGRLIQEMVIRL